MIARAILKGLILVCLFPYSILILPFILSMKKMGCLSVVLLMIATTAAYPVWGLYNLFEQKKIEAKAIQECQDLLIRGKHANPEECSQMYRQYVGGGFIEILGEFLPQPLIVKWLNERNR